MLLICMNKQSETGRAVAASKHFGVNILGANQADLAERFAQKGGDKFAGVEVTPGKWGEPLFTQALATLECTVSEETSGGTHYVFLAEVENGSARGGTPLAYFKGEFGRLELTREQLEHRTSDPLEDELRAADADLAPANEGARLGAALAAIRARCHPMTALARAGRRHGARRRGRRRVRHKGALRSHDRHRASAHLGLSPSPRSG